jgi:hypothetical protein
MERERRYPFLLVNKMGGKPRLAKLAKEQGDYEQFARRNKWPRLEDERKPTRGIPPERRRRSHGGGHRSRQGPQVAAPVDPTVHAVAREDCLEGRWDMGSRAAEQRTSEPDSWQSSFPETDEGPSPQKKWRRRESRLVQNLKADIANLDDHSESDGSIDYHMIQKIREMKAILGRKWAARSLTDLGRGLLSVGLKGLEREKVLLARREARLKMARQMEYRRLKDSMWSGGNGPSKSAQPAAKVERLPHRVPYRYADDSRAVWRANDIDPDLWKYLLGHEALAEYSPEENLPYTMELDEVEEEARGRSTGTCLVS